MPDEHGKAKILPFYLVVDVSYSMTQDGKLDAANGITTELKNALAEQPVIADKVRFSVIDFSDEAQVVFPLGDLSLQDDDVHFDARGGTSFVAAFRTLRTEIDRDVKQLKADGFDVHRPAVFFISDGDPTDADGEWQRAFSDLTSYDKTTKTGFPYYPNVIPFGVGATPGTLKELIYPRERSKCYMAKDGANPGDALRQMVEVLVSSTMLSGASFGAGGPGMVLPDAGDLGGDIVEADYEDLV